MKHGVLVLAHALISHLLVASPSGQQYDMWKHWLSMGWGFWKAGMSHEDSWADLWRIKRCFSNCMVKAASLILSEPQVFSYYNTGGKICVKHKAKVVQNQALFIGLGVCIILRRSFDPLTLFLNHFNINLCKIYMCLYFDGSKPGGKFRNIPPKKGSKDHFHPGKPVVFIMRSESGLESCPVDQWRQPRTVPWVLTENHKKEKYFKIGRNSHNTG